MTDLTDRVRINASDLESYSIACLGALYVTQKADPQQMVCLLRGGHPPSKVVHTLTKDYLGKDMSFYAIPTSDFLKNKKYLTYALAEEVLNTADRSDGNGRVLTIDTAITGSSSRQFMKEFADNFRKICQKGRFANDLTLDYFFVRFWDNAQDRYSKTKCKAHLISHDQTMESQGRTSTNHLRLHDYNFGVRSLISEDNPLLLGVDYPIEFKEEENEGISGQKSEFVSSVKVQLPIHVENEDGKDSCYQPHGNETTSDLFIDLVTERSRENIAKLASINERANLATLEYPPYLVSFCKQLVAKR